MERTVPEQAHGVSLRCGERVGSAAIGLRQPHREVDRGVIGHVEKQDLRGANQQGRFNPRRFGRRAALEQTAEQMAQGAEPAQRRADDVARQSAVALREQAEPVV